MTVIRMLVATVTASLAAKDHFALLEFITIDYLNRA